jgi:uncharacterized protein YggE
MTRFLFSLTLIIMLPVVGPPAADALGQDGAAPSGPPIIRTQGEAVLTVEPDLAELQIGMVTEDPSAKAASQNNAVRADAVLKTLYELLGRNADIKTIGYSINPVYATPRDGNSVITHYRATSMVRVKTDKIKQVGEIIERANKAGADTAGALQFTLKDDSAVQLKALEQASLEARAKANAIASALGLKIIRILEVEEIDRGPGPIFRSRGFAEADMASASTPIEAGTVEIDAAVVLTAEATQ